LNKKYIIKVQPSHNRTVTVRRPVRAARLRKTPVGLTPFVVFCSATFFCARKNATHFSLSGAKKRRLQPERYMPLPNCPKIVSKILLIYKKYFFRYYEEG
jgi:hypothetical protein